MNLEDLKKAGSYLARKSIEAVKSADIGGKIISGVSSAAECINDVKAQIEEVKDFRRELEEEYYRLEEEERLKVERERSEYRRNEKRKNIASVRNFISEKYGEDYACVIDKLGCLCSINWYFDIAQTDFVEKYNITAEQFNDEEYISEEYDKYLNDKRLTYRINGIIDSLKELENNYSNDIDSSVSKNIEDLTELLSKVSVEQIKQLLSTSYGCLAFDNLEYIPEEDVLKLLKNNNFLPLLCKELSSKTINPFALATITNHYLLDSAYIVDFINGLDTITKSDELELSDDYKDGLVDFLGTVDLSFLSGDISLTSSQDIISKLLDIMISTTNVSSEEVIFLGKTVLPYFVNELNLLGNLFKNDAPIRIYDDTYAVSSYLVRDEDRYEARVLETNGKCNTDNTFEVANDRMVTFSNTAEMNRRLEIARNGQNIDIVEPKIDSYSEFGTAEDTIIAKLDSIYCHIPGEFGVQIDENNNIFATLIDGTTIKMTSKGDIVSHSKSSPIMNSLVEQIRGDVIKKYKKF